MSLSTDPITLAAQGIWTVLESHEPLASLVRIPNRIKLDGDKLDPLNKSSVGPSDLPEIRLIPASWTSTDHQGRAATSSSRFITVTFNLTICTSKMRTGDEEGIYPIMFHALCALWKVINQNPGSPETRYLWPEGGGFELATRGPDEDTPAPGVTGWATIAQVRATVVLSNQALGIGT